MSSCIEPIGSVKYDRDMARPRNFSREGVLEKAPSCVLEARLCRRQPAGTGEGYGGEQIRPLLGVFGEGGSVSGEPALLPRSPAATQLAHGRAPGLGQYRAVFEA